MARPRVILRRCEAYRVDAIRAIVAEGVRDLGVKLDAPVFVKPNVVTANRRYNRHAYTAPEVVEATLRVIRDAGVREVTVGESGGFGVPGRLFLAEAGYLDLGRRTGVRVIDLNEWPTRRVTLRKAAWHHEIDLSTAVAGARTKVFVPKLKYHIFAGITCALKLNIGLLQHHERMLFHDHRIHEKIVDLLEVGWPDLVVCDAVETTFGFESAPYPAPLGLLMIADHPLAADAVAATVMGYDPREVAHLRIASERGYGSLDLADYSIEGDVGVDELRSRTARVPRLFQDLQALDTPIRFFQGGPPGLDVVCDGGCEAAVKGALGTIEKRRPGSLARARPGGIVTGVHRGDVILPGQPVMLVGTCTRVEGRLVAGRVRRVAGCPIGAKALLARLPFTFGMPSPLLDIRDAFLYVAYSIRKGWARLMLRLGLRR